MVVQSNITVVAPVRGQTMRHEGNGGGGGAGRLKHPHITNSQLLFFDTFSHEVIEELNLDLVQVSSVYTFRPLGSKD